MMLINKVELFVERHEVENPKATIILSHGIAENSNRYLETVQALNDSGYTVVRYDHRGHGQSGGARGKLKSFHQLIDDLHELVKIEKSNKPKKIFLLGHSMGGLLVNLYAVKYGDVNGIISSAAPTYFVKQVKPLRFLGYKWLSWIKIKSPFNPGDLSRIPSVEKEYLTDSLNLQRFNISLVAGMMVGGVRYLNKNLSKYIVPVLYIHGGKDPVVPAAYSTRIYELVPSSDRELIIYPDSVHEILNDLGQETVRNDILNWLGRQTV